MYIWSNALSTLFLSETVLSRTQTVPTLRALIVARKDQKFSGA